MADSSPELASPPEAPYIRKRDQMVGISFTDGNIYAQWNDERLKEIRSTLTAEQLYVLGEYAQAVFDSFLAALYGGAQ